MDIHLYVGARINLGDQEYLLSSYRVVSGDPTKVEIVVSLTGCPHSPEEDAEITFFIDRE